MKKVYLLMSMLFVFFLLNGLSSQATPVAVYPFDSITITSAYKFEVEITDTPNEHSFLYPSVEAGEIISVYVGKLKYISDGKEVEASESILIITDSDGTDIVRWLINSGHYSENLKQYDYSSHITIDPNVGVVKTHDDGIAMEATISERGDDYTLTDNLNIPYEMVEGSLQRETDLNIVISIYS